MFHPYNVARHLSSMSQQRDNLDGTDTKPTFEIPGLVGVSFVLVFLLLILMVFVWLWALWALVTHWDSLHPVAKILGVLGLFPGIPVGPVGTLVVVYGCLNIKSCRQKKRTRKK